MLTLFKTSYIVYLILICYSQYVDSSEQEEEYPCVSKDGSHKICRKVQNCPSGKTLLEKEGICPDHCNFAFCYEVSPAASTTSESVPDPEPKIVRTVTYSNRTGGEISKQKCKEYAELRKSFVLDTYINTTECDFQLRPDGLGIAGGQAARQWEFPHMAVIGYKTGTQVDWSCGGALISEQFVLTAAHCLDDIAKGTAKFVKLGTLRISDIDSQDIPISEVIFYPDYGDTKYHDIGLIKLSKKIIHGANIGPACLHTERHIPHEKATVAGWGNTRATSSTGSDDLLKASLEFFSAHKCNKTFRREINRQGSTLQNGIVEDFMICAGSTREIKDSCQGDSGGPLQVYHENPEEIRCMHNILGVVSAGKLCGLAPNVPGIYTRVSAYIKWIEDIVWPE